MVEAIIERSPVASIYDLWIVLTRRWRLVLLMTFVCTAIAVAIAYRLPVKYRAEVLLQPADQTSTNQLNGLAAQFGINVGTGNTAALQAQAILESKAFTMAFIRQNKLLPILFADRWDPVRRRWSVDDPIDIPTELDGYRTFRDSIREVTRDRSTGQVLVAITWTDARQATDWANKMVAMLNDTVRRRALNEATDSLRYLRAEYAQTTLSDVRTSVVALMATELNKSMLANVQNEYAFRVLDPAVVPNRRSSPNRVLIAAGGAAVGMALGIVFALLVDYRRKLLQR
jgi:uncharacterized protein involved in exopolysaccharide biosynthesis